MELSYWQSRWKKGLIGFHLNQPHHSLESFFKPYLKENDLVYLPLCGKTPDIKWFANQNCRVQGTEISEIAIQDFFKEHNLNPTVSQSHNTTLYRADNIELRQADFLKDAKILQSTADFIYDRAALVALPPQKRPGYIEKAIQILKPGGYYALVAFTYDQDEMTGPPFSVPLQEISAYFDAFVKIQFRETEILETLKKFQERGLSSMSEQLYLFQKPQI